MTSYERNLTRYDVLVFNRNAGNVYLIIRTCHFCDDAAIKEFVSGNQLKSFIRCINVLSRFF